MELIQFLHYVVGYIIISLVFLLFNSIIAGYNGNSYSFQDTIDSILWPLSLSVLIGLVIRITIEKYKEKRAQKVKVKQANKIKVVNG